VQICRAAPGDIEPALAAIGQAFGLELRAPTVHTLVASVPEGTLLVAKQDGVVLGTAAAIGFGPTGWLGGITVAAEARGRGLGRELTRVALEALGPRETVLLLASALGRPIYDRMGFVPEGRYRVFRSTASGSGEFAPADPRAADLRATGEDRCVVLAECAAVGCRNSVALHPPWPALPIVGGDGAEELLRGLIRPGLRLAAPEQNERAVAVLSELGEERDAVERMRLGPPVSWDPSRVWGVFSLFFG
jgi:predicted N-acetyltransferase YhbS